MTRIFSLLLTVMVLCLCAGAQELFVTDVTGNNVRRYDLATGVSVVFASGGGLLGAFGLGFGPDGNLYVGSFQSDQVLRYDGRTGAFLSLFASGSGLDGPTGLVFGPDGNLYVSSSQNDQVLRFNGTTGAFIDVFASGGGLDAPGGLTFGPDGNLYVTSSLSDQVLRYNGVSGAFIDVFAGGGGLDAPVDLKFGPDGNLFVSSGDTGQVLRYDGVTGAFLNVFTSGGGLIAPLGIIFGRDQNLYVADPSGAQVQRFNGTTGAFIDVVASGGGLQRPAFLTFGPERPVQADAPFQVRYAANLNGADSLINITNTGAHGAMPFGPGIGPPAGNLCVNVYAFSPDEQMVGCCSCHVTPNGLASLSVYNDIRAITLTGLTPNSMVIKLVATATGGTPADPVHTGGASSCSQSAAGLNVTHPVARAGLAAWATTGHAPGSFPVPGAPAPFAITETKFTPATLSAQEIASLNNRCTAIIGNGSTFGTCRSCSSGGRGAVRQP